jgi:hypothetical protein
MIKPDFSLFTQKRLVFIDRPSASTVENEAASEVKKQVSSVEKGIIEQKQNPEAAAGRAKFMIGEIVKEAQKKLGYDLELRKNQKEYEAFLVRLEAIKKRAISEISANMEKYNKIAGFVAKRTEALLMHDGYRKYYEQKVQGQYLIMQIPELADASLSLLKMIASIDSLDLTGTGMNEEKDKLRDTLEAQMTLFDKEPEKIVAFHERQINTVKEHTSTLRKISEQGRSWIGNPPYNDTEVRQDWQRVFYLQRLQREAAATPEKGLARLAALAAMSLAEIIPLLNEWDKKRSSSEAFKDHEKLWAQYQKAEENYQNAKLNYENIERKSTTTQAELAQARAWLVGAEQTVNEHLLKMERAVAAAQRDNNQNPLDFGDEKQYFASIAPIRTGETEEVSGEKIQEPAFQLVADIPKETTPKFASKDKEKAGAKPGGKKEAS